MTLTRQSKNAAWTTQPHYQYVFVEKRSPNGQAIYRLRPVDLDSIPEGMASKEASDLKAFQRYYKMIPLVNKMIPLVK